MSDSPGDKEEAPRTLKQLAKKLGVSPAAISLSLNGRAREGRISPETEKRIIEAAEHYGFRPNKLAKQLRSGKTSLIGVVVPDIANPFFAEFLQAAEIELREAGNVVLIGDSREQETIENEIILGMCDQRVDALIVAPVGEWHAGFQEVTRTRTPLVLFDRVLKDNDKFPAVCSDHYQAAFDATSHLIECGHRQILCLRGSSESFADEQRVLGFQAAIQKGKLQDCPIIGTSYDREPSAEAVAAFLQEEGAGKVTACLSLGGQITLGLLDTLRTEKVDIPAEWSLLAFDDQPWATLTTPALTTVRQPIRRMAKRVVELVLSGETSGSPETDQHFACDILQRDSIRQL